jgi:hypothetical protein
LLSNDTAKGKIHPYRTQPRARSAKEDGPEHERPGLDRAVGGLSGAKGEYVTAWRESKAVRAESAKSNRNGRFNDGGGLKQRFLYARGNPSASRVGRVDPSFLLGKEKE